MRRFRFRFGSELIVLFWGYSNSDGLMKFLRDNIMPVGLYSKVKPEIKNRSWNKAVDGLQGIRLPLTTIKWAVINGIQMVVK